MDKEAMLKEIEDDIRHCMKCDLHKTKTHYVPGVGPANAKIMFVGEGPGRDEDIQGLPFVGAAGKLLTQLLQSIGIERSEVFIGNIVKCRPPNNRVPTPNEIEACVPYLYAQISVIEPEIIVTLGNTPLNALVSPALKVSAVHGRVFEKDGLKFFVTFHPAAALYHGEYKELLKNDFLKLKQILDETKIVGGS
ncbi:uracil-DNA glycosylase [Caldisericum exile]|uniref:Type-4 uracil-DNA glycosylase n=1 Tax=Caldisericum exile (strain DSM 21853 / NBRC 104410 / AZM16c01) TaxID=511051 RepID=A0A7U6GDK4_CALEA|nr:uracil-DNA glycosylase [Caldisericum exile]BAL80447.1 uracil-DNA glycosylase [Caldisericum exile AZM16c01]